MEIVKTLRLNQFMEGEQEAFFYANLLQHHLPHNHIHIDKPHKHEFYATYFFCKGKGRHEIDFQNYEVVPGSLFFMSPGQVHHWDLSDDAEGFVFFHSQEFYDLHYVKNTIRKFPFFGSLSAKRTLYLSEIQMIEFEALFKKILVEAHGNDRHKYSYILSLITQVYIESNRLLSDQQKDNREETRNYYHHFERFENLLEKNFKVMKAPSAYAEQMNMTVKHLNRIVKSIANLTTQELIIARVVLEAKRMLTYTDFHFNEIAYELGYEDYPHFSKAFKKTVGDTPSEFVKKYNL